MVMGAVAVVIGGLVVVLGGGGVGLLAVFAPDLVQEYTGLDMGGGGGSDIPDAPELVPDTEANQRDLHVLRSSLESLKGRVKKACKAKPGETTAATVVVDGQGTVLGARGTGRFEACMGKALTGRTLERTESRTVRLTYDFLW